MTLFEIVILVCIVLFCIGLVTSMFCMAFQDTEMFRAVDEKIAEMIRGKEE